MTKAVPRQKGLPRGVKVCKIHYKYAKNAHNFESKEGSPKRIFLIIHRYDYCNEYSSSIDGVHDVDTSSSGLLLKDSTSDPCKNVF